MSVCFSQVRLELATPRPARHRAAVFRNNGSQAGYFASIVLREGFDVSGYSFFRETAPACQRVEQTSAPWLCF